MLGTKLLQTEFKEMKDDLANCSLLQIQSTYKLYKPITTMINSIAISNKDYDDKYDDKINPTGDYDEKAIIQMNGVYKEAQTGSKSTTLSKHIQDTAEKKEKKMYGAYIPLDKC